MRHAVRQLAAGDLPRGRPKMGKRAMTSRFGPRLRLMAERIQSLWVASGACWANFSHELRRSGSLAIALDGLPIRSRNAKVLERIISNRRVTGLMDSLILPTGKRRAKRQPTRRSTIGGKIAGDATSKPAGQDRRCGSRNLVNAPREVPNCCAAPSKTGAQLRCATRKEPC